MPTDLHRLSLTQIAAGLGNGDFSALELTERLLDRIAASETSLNAFITVTAEQALAAAQRADAARAAGKGGVLNGLPLVHKDIFCTRDVLTSCGSRMLENFIAP
jgi:aspartyl-tRNA(Asn)/glutamyl-tRNA(Gln) amidotransferase subunit A